MQSLSSQRAAITWLFFALGLGGGNWLVRIVSIRDLLHLNHAALGSVLLAGAAGAMSAFLLSSKLRGPKIARVATLMTTLIYFLTLPLAGSATNRWSLAATLFVMGASSGLMNVLMNHIALDFEYRVSRPVLGSLHASCSLGTLVGASFGTFISAMGLSTFAHLASIAMALSAVTLLFAPLIMHLSSLTQRELVPLATPQVAAQNTKKTLTMLGVMVAAAAICEGGMADWTGVYFRDALRCSLGEAGRGYIVFSTSMVATRFLSDWMTKRFGAKRVAIASGSLVAVGIACELCVLSVYSAFFGVALIGAGAACTVPIVYREASRRNPGASAGSLATMANCSYAGFLIGPPTIGYLAELTSLRTALSFLGILGLLIAAGGLTLTALSPKSEAPA